ncbi:MAG: alcohol dehydrogenase catalytic domain-containing protein [Acidobacteria bacterium]|nr:alcohol dehydrogenase catalytic domain-containing protein [Acidobacteriota bacterium]
MQETVSAVVMSGAGRPLELRRFPVPKARAGGAVLEMIASEVCGTDVHLHHGRLSGVPFPIIPGHVNCGRVLETGGALFDVEGRPIETGAVVTFYDVFGTCGACWYCLVARAGTRCPHRKVYGITTSAADGLLGGWAERIEILPGVRLVTLPEDVAPEDFMGGGCGLPTGFHAVERAGITLGDTVVVHPKAVPEGLEMLRDAGRYVVVGQYTDGGDTPVNPHRHINRRHATILGCWGYEFTHLHRALAMMARHKGRFAWRDLITREYALSDAGSALADMEKLSVVKAIMRARI